MSTDFLQSFPTTFGMGKKELKALSVYWS